MRSDDEGTAVLAIATLAVKGVLLVMLALVLLDPTWGHLEGKAPVARALLYPAVALVVPACRLLRPTSTPAPTPYPWLSDLLFTLAGFTDILGNRLDLYDRIWWFDDLIHLTVTLAVTAAFVLLTLDSTADFSRVRDRALAFGMTAAVAWELFEFVSFVARSTEAPTAYADTVGDLVLDWTGAALAAWLVHAWWRHHLPPQRAPAKLDGPALRIGTSEDPTGPNGPPHRPLNTETMST